MNITHQLWGLRFDQHWDLILLLVEFNMGLKKEEMRKWAYTGKMWMEPAKAGFGRTKRRSAVPICALIGAFYGYKRGCDQGNMRILANRSQGAVKKFAC